MSAPPQGVEPPGREYVVFWLGKATNLHRVDAIARVARGALMCTRPAPVHFLFQDGYLVSLRQELLPVWYNTDSEAEGTPGSQVRLERLLGAEIAAQRGGAEAARGVRCVASRSPPRTAEQWRQCLEQVLVGDAVPSKAATPTPRFDAVLELVESGCPIHFGAPEARGCPRWAADVVGRALVVLGGVMDMEDGQKEALAHVCGGLGVRHRLLSLGRRSELTSKCIKAFEAADDLGLLAPSLLRCQKADWKPQGEAACAEDPDHQAPFHLVVALADSTVADYCAKPEAANLYVDTFLRSKKVNRSTALTLLGADGLALTIPRDVGVCLKEREGTAWLREAAKRTEQLGLHQVLARWCAGLASRGPRGVRQSSPVLLHADSGAPVGGRRARRLALGGPRRDAQEVGRA